MTNKELAAVISLYSKYLVLHSSKEDEKRISFKVKQFNNASFQIRRQQQAILELNDTEIHKIRGIGSSTFSLIQQIQSRGEIEELVSLIQRTPQGVQNMLLIKGLGAKKIKTLWKEKEIESLGELEYACKENRLIQWKGFGEKTQNSILEQIQFIQSGQGKLLLPHAQILAHEIQLFFESLALGNNICFGIAGQLYTRNAIIDELIFVCNSSSQGFISAFNKATDKLEGFELNSASQKDLNESMLLCSYRNFNVKIYFTSKEDDSYNESVIILLSLNRNLVENQFSHFKTEIENCIETGDSISEELCDKILTAFNPDKVATEQLDSSDINRINNPKELIDHKDIKGVIHSHTTWSDGAQTIKEMALESQRLGYKYLVVSDHSKAAFYANGLEKERLFKQWEEIDTLNMNSEFSDFKIFKGIECDILNDGSLDYDDDIINQFEVVIASIHSNLKMDESKATARLIKAIEHPATHILGHLTSRLLLSRKGYEVDINKIIDACAQNRVSIELNANPRRLDIDWKFIDLAQKKDVLISINPDAHSIQGMKDIQYGVYQARKGGLLKASCLNFKTTIEFEHWISSK